MGGALVAGLLSSGWGKVEELVVAEISEGRRIQLSEAYGVETLARAVDAVKGAGTVLLALKQADVAPVCQDIGGSLAGGACVVSIVAGMPTHVIEARLPEGTPVVRAMPNTPALVGSGMAGICAGRHANEEHLRVAEDILSAVGRVVRLPEHLLDAVTALSGTGPAYCFLLAEALVDAGIYLGLPRDTATTLAVQTMLGSARMLAETARSPADLRAQVTSPGGTTTAAMRVLEQAGVRAAFLEAVKAAAERSHELGRAHTIEH